MFKCKLYAFEGKKSCFPLRHTVDVSIAHVLHNLICFACFFFEQFLVFDFKMPKSVLFDKIINLQV